MKKMRIQRARDSAESRPNNVGKKGEKLHFPPAGGGVKRGNNAKMNF